MKKAKEHAPYDNRPLELNDERLSIVRGKNKTNEYTHKMYAYGEFVIGDYVLVEDTFGYPEIGRVVRCSRIHTDDKIRGNYVYVVLGETIEFDSLPTSEQAAAWNLPKAEEI